MTNKRHKNLAILIYTLIISLLVFGLYRFGKTISTRSIAQGSMTISTTYAKYQLGDPINFSITNNYSATITIHNNCPSEPLEVYRYENSAWTRLHDTAIIDCSKQASDIKILPTQTLQSGFADWTNLFTKPGKYRIAIYIEYYNDIAYTDFDIVDKTALPELPALLPEKKQATQSTNKTSTSTNTSTSSGGTEANENPNQDNDSETTAYAPQTITVYVTSGGNYSQTNLTLHVSDTLKIIYQSPIGSEVRTRFTAKSGTTATISSLTLDSERTSGTKTMSSAGTWTFKADDHSGNTGTLTVTN